MTDKSDTKRQRMLWVIVWDIGGASGCAAHYRYIDRHELTDHERPEDATLYDNVGDAVSAMLSLSTPTMGTKHLHVESVWV